MSLWKNASFENDVWSNMEKNLETDFHKEDTIKQTKALIVIDELNKAAELFDEVGKEKVATFLTALVVKLAEDINEFKAIVPDTKNLTPEKEVSNLKNHGWVFDLNNLSEKPKEVNEDLKEAEKAEKDLSHEELNELTNKYKLNLNNEDEDNESFEDTE